MRNIAYDISVLGYGSFQPHFRTGVYRLNEEVFRGLLKTPDIHVTATATLSPTVWARSRQYLQRHHLPTVLEPSSLGLRALGRIDSVLLPLLQKDQSIPLPQRILRRGLSEVGHRIESRLSSIPKRSTWDLFHSGFYPIPKEIHVPRILTVCDLINIQFPIWEPGGDAYMRQILESLRKDDGAICISESTRKDLLEFRPDLNPKHVWAIPLAASADFSPVLDPQLRENVLSHHGLSRKPFVLSVCTLDGRKNIPTLIEAFSQVAPKFREVTLALVGASGKAMRELSELVRKRRIEGQVRFLGYVDDSDLPALYSAASAFVYPSHYEGFGLPVLEAMACGAPVIVSDTSSFPEVVGNAGLYADPREPESFASAIENILSDSEMSRRLAGQSLARAGLFSWEKTVALTVEAYSKMK